MPKTNLVKSLNSFINMNEKLAKKYGCKVSVQFTGSGFPGMKSEEIVLADHTKDKKESYEE